jgi:hypothetical protein
MSLYFVAGRFAGSPPHRPTEGDCPYYAKALKEVRNGTLFFG